MVVLGGGAVSYERGTPAGATSGGVGEAFGEDAADRSFIFVY